MSGKVYNYSDKIIEFLPLGDFEKNLSYEKDAKSIYLRIKDSMPEGKGSIEIDYTGKRYKYDDNDWIFFEAPVNYEKKEATKSIEKPSGEKYGVTFKAVEGASAGKDRSFRYKFNLDGFSPDEYFMTLPQELDLKELINILLDDFHVSPGSLKSYLATLDIGTFNIGLEKRFGKYDLIRLNQLSAPSNRSRDLERLENEIESYKDQVSNLKQEITSYQDEIIELEKNNADIGRLKEIEQKYQDLTEKLNISDNSDNLGSLKLASKRNEIKGKLKEKIAGFVLQDLRRFGLENKKIETVSTNVLEDMNSCIDHIEDTSVLDQLISINTLDDIQKSSDALYSIYIRYLSDALLFHFSPVSNRSDIAISEQNIALKKYDLELFEIPVGSAETHPRMCRVQDVKDSDYARGTCLETITYGIRRISDGSVIYKADVVISS